MSQGTWVPPEAGKGKNKFSPGASGRKQPRKTHLRLLIPKPGDNLSVLFAATEFVGIWYRSHGKQTHTASTCCHFPSISEAVQAQSLGREAP